MSKISPLIARYLNEAKSIELQGFGRFSVNNTDVLGEDNDKNPVLPISFDYNPNAITEDSFISFIMKETGKIKPLAIADLDTYLSLGKQLLNISKPLVIEGVGTINKATSGILEFIPGIFEHPKISTDNDRDRRMRQAKEVTRKEKEVSFERDYKVTPKATKSIFTKILGFLTVVAILAGIGYFAYKFIFNSEKSSSKEVASNEKDSGGSKNDQQKDSTTTQAGSSTTVDSLGRTEFKMVIDVLPKEEAKARYNKLVSYNYKPILYSKDSVIYKIAIPIRVLVQDTARVRDSLQRLFIPPAKIREGKKVIIEQ